MKSLESFPDIQPVFYHGFKVVTFTGRSHLTRMKINRWLLFSILILALGVLWIWASRTSNTTQAANITAPQQGFLAPNLSLETLDGKKVALSDFKGKVVLVNFWASWCPPCKAEMQAIQNTYQAYQAQGLVVLAVNATFEDSTDSARSFASAADLTFPVLTDPNGDASRLYHIDALPTSFFVDRQGKIQRVVVGGPMPEALLRSQVEQMLAGQ